MALPKAGVELVAEGLAGFTADMGRANSAVADFGKSGASAGSAFDKGFGEVVTGALRKIGELGVEALLKAGQAIGNFAKDSIGLAGDFQAGMLEFQAVAGKSVDTKGLEKFHDLFLDLGKELPVSTSDVQQAAIEMVKGGIDPATIAAGGLKQNIQFAAAAMGGDLVQAATISSKILGGWAAANATAEEKANFLTHATDQLTKAANASSVDVHELSLGIFNAQGIAKTAGVSFDDLTTTLALLSPRFASSSEAGNSLKNVIARLQPTTKPATEAMAALGLITEDGANKFYDAQGRFVGFQQAAQILQDSLKGLTQQQQQATLQQIFGNDAMNAAAALAELGASGYQSMADSLASANGVLDNAALKQQGYNTALDNAKGSFEALQITVGEKLLPILTDLLNNTIAPGINTLTTMAEAVFGNEEAFNSLSPTLQGIVRWLQNDLPAAVKTASDFWTGTLWPALQDVGNFIQTTVIPAIGQIVDWFQDRIPAATQTVSSIWSNTLKPALDAVGKVLVKDVFPILRDLADTVLPVLEDALQTAGAAWQNVLLPVIQTVWKYLNEYTIPILKDVAAWMKENIPPAVDTLAKFLQDTLFPAFKKVWSFLDENIIPVFKTVADVGLTILGDAVSDLADLWENILWPALKTVGSFIKDDLGPIISALVDVNMAILKKASDALAGLWQKVLQPALKAVGDYISEKLGPVFQKIGDWLSQTFNPILEKVKTWLDKVTGGFGGVSGAVEKVVDWLHNLADKISNLKLPDWLTPGSPTPLETGLLGIGSALQKSVSPGLDTMQQGLRDIGAAFGETDLINALQQLGEDAWAGFADGLKSGVRSVVRVVNSTATTVKGAFEDAFGAHSPATLIIPIGESVTQGLMVGIENLIPGLISLIDSTAGALIDGLTKNREELSKQISEMADDLISQAKDIASQIQEAIADSFGATASIDRQLADNLDKLDKITNDFYRKHAEGALKQAEITARQFADPTQGAKFFQMRSKQIFEEADLKERLAKSEDVNEQARLRKRLALINDAQQAEISAFNASATAAGSPAQDIRDAIAQLFTGDLGGKLPGALENSLINQLMRLLSQLTAPASNPWANPPASASQIYGQGAAQNSYYNTRSINMPVYTNQSPSVIQDSAAIVWASMP